MGGRCCHPCLENVYLHSQSSMETNVIRSWLGHVSFTTTNEYIEPFAKFPRQRELEAGQADRG